jgi:hypothetical protein
MAHLKTVEEVTGLIKNHKHLLLAGDEQLLRKLPNGHWIGGSIPYFMEDEGGIQTADKIYVDDVTHLSHNVRIKAYSVNELPNIPKDCPQNGVSFIIIPGLSETHLTYAKEAPTYDGMYMSPIIGWIAGIDLKDLGSVTPKVFNGETGTAEENKAVLMHMELTGKQLATIDIINLFKQGDGDTLTFDEDGFQATNVYVNGQKTNFVQYVKKNNIDTKLPLVADYNGAMINTSFQVVDEENDVVKFYAPVFKGIEYKIAAPVKNYTSDFERQVPNVKKEQVGFACNCILNYLYAELEGKKTGNMTGPITFGEIAYQLLNQTFTYVKVEENQPSNVTH